MDSNMNIDPALFETTFNPNLPTHGPQLGQQALNDTRIAQHDANLDPNLFGNRPSGRDGHATTGPEAAADQESGNPVAEDEDE
jgi:hypothetical protein